MYLEFSSLLKVCLKHPKNETIYIFLVHFFKAIEGSLTADHELQAWGKELVMPRIDGGVGLLVCI